MKRKYKTPQRQMPKPKGFSRSRKLEIEVKLSAIKLDNGQFVGIVEFNKQLYKTELQFPTELEAIENAKTEFENATRDIRAEYNIELE